MVEDQLGKFASMNFVVVFEVTANIRLIIGVYVYACFS